ncbi:Thiamine biosynthesis protein ThiS [Sedimentisphaera cyanobacteriorum]|uniref:Thiamine biosynthesis protein ThiS n=1 Tax=Sedimentisphaera cyanobacteriorum TaxID=1940790 RepID=A0A1Q2HPR8_9BACT|nr:sulfur carrier protein ThiS [Sedimentisphaera cyanobacteriorum]AQQ09321.1 Thiamine biosynthesis protein ThiS [Sedimentisphaera cyanobacteriorum]
MQIRVNGKDMNFSDNSAPATVKELIDHLGIDSAAVVAEVDGEIVEKRNFENTKIKDSQKIELIRFVGGG